MRSVCNINGLQIPSVKKKKRRRYPAASEGIGSAEIMGLNRIRPDFFFLQALISQLPKLCA